MTDCCFGLLGRLPVPMYGEYQYNVVKPDVVDAAWEFRAGINFIIPNPFSPITKEPKP